MSREMKADSAELPDMKSLLRPLWHASKITLARAYRPMLGRTRFVAVTGSCAKTTTLELIAAILAGRGRVHKCSALTNPPHRVGGSILTTLPWHRFCVHELGGFEPGVLAGSARLLRPQVGVVTTVGMDHYSAFKGLDNTAKEKGALVESLPASGVAVLNADDERVLAMRERTTASVITYGLAEGADVRGDNVSSAWPDPLSLTVEYQGESVELRTRLLGEHWVTAILAAVAAGITLGVPPADAARAVERVEPVEGRMSPCVTPDGVTFILDIWKAPLYSIPIVLRFLKTARAARKVLVVGSVSDYPGRTDRNSAISPGRRSRSPTRPSSSARRSAAERSTRLSGEFFSPGRAWKDPGASLRLHDDVFEWPGSMPGPGYSLSRGSPARGRATGRPSRPTS